MLPGAIENSYNREMGLFRLLPKENLFFQIKRKIAFSYCPRQPLLLILFCIGGTSSKKHSGKGEEREAGLPEKGEIRWEEGSIDVLGLFQKKKDYAYKNCKMVQDKGEMHVIGGVMGDYVLALLPTRMSAQISIPPIRLFIHQ